MSSRDVGLTLRQISEFCEEVGLLVAGHTRAELEQRPELRRALERCIELIGEAVNRLPDELLNRHQNVPWAEIVGMRNLLIHGYDVVNFEVLWDTAAQDVPRLLLEIKAIQRVEGVS